MEQVINFVVANQAILLPVLYVWSITVKGVALWHAAFHKQRNWFVAILVLNSLGILELLYLFKFCKKPLAIKEIRSWFLRKK